MRKTIIIIVISAFAISTLFLVSGIVKKLKKQTEIADKIRTMPFFSFLTLDKGTFSSSEIRNGPLLIVRFHPECEHCQYEIAEIMKSNIPLSGIRVILISSAETDEIRKFFSQFNLSEYNSVIPLADPSYLFGDIFGSDIVPTNYIYDKELKLVKVLYGEVKTETVFKYLTESGQDN